VTGQHVEVFARPRDLAPITEDLSLVMRFLMGIDAKLEQIKALIQEDDDGEEGTDA
jgi:hypothetical protein